MRAVLCITAKISREWPLRVHTRPFSDVGSTSGLPPESGCRADIDERLNCANNRLRQAARSDHSALMFAVLMKGHHFSTSALKTIGTCNEEKTLPHPLPCRRSYRLRDRHRP